MEAKFSILRKQFRGYRYQWLMSSHPLKAETIRVPRNRTALNRRKWFSGFMLRVKERNSLGYPGPWGRQAGSRHYHINDVQIAFSGERQRSSNLNSSSVPSSVRRLEVTWEGSSAQTIFSPIPKQIWKGFELWLWHMLSLMSLPPSPKPQSSGVSFCQIILTSQVLLISNP